MSLVSGRFDKLDLQMHREVKTAVNYQEYDRGVTKDDPHESMRTCSQEYLDALVSDVSSIRDEFKLNYKKMLKSAVKLCLEKIYEECERLVHSPELFVDKTTAHKFFGSIGYLSRQCTLFAAAWKRRIHRQKVLAQVLVKRYQKRSRRHFAKGRKPWQQFLGRNAPGSGTGIRAPSKNMSAQIVPWAGVRILCGWSKECKAIIKTIEDKHGGTPITQPGTQLTDNHVGIGLDGNITRVRQYFVAPNPFFTTLRRYPERFGATTKLERLGQTMDAFDHEVAHAPRITGRMLPTIVIQKMIPKKGGVRGQ